MPTAMHGVSKPPPPPPLEILCLLRVLFVVRVIAMAGFQANVDYWATSEHGDEGGGGDHHEGQGSSRPLRASKGGSHG